MGTGGLLGKSDEMPGDAFCWIFISSWENSNTVSFHGRKPGISYISGPLGSLTELTSNSEL